MTMPSASVLDRSAWRQAFAEPGETLVLILASGDDVVDPVLDTLPSERPFRILLHGAKTSRPKVHHLEPWAASLVSALIEISDVTIAFPGREELLKDAWGTLSKSQLIVLPRGSAPEGRSSGAEILEYDNLLAELSAAFKTPKAAVPRNLVLYNDWGIGDELLLSAVAREILRAYPSCGIWIRSRYGFRFPSFLREGEPPSDALRIETIYQNPTMYGPDRHAPFPGHLVQQMLDKVFVDTGLLVKAEDLRPCLEGPKHPARKSARRQVLLHSKGNPRLPSKEWGVERWSSLTGILHARGVEIVQVGAPDEPLLPHAIDRRGTPVVELQGLVAQTSLVVCLVGFLMHLAAAVGTPALVIYGGREHPSIDGYPDQVHLSSGALPCRGRWGCHLAPDIACPHGMRCMEGLTPELVAGEILDVLEAAP